MGQTRYYKKAYVGIIMKPRFTGFCLFMVQLALHFNRASYNMLIIPLRSVRSKTCKHETYVLYD